MIKVATTTTPEIFSQKVGRRLGKNLIQKLGQSPNACWLFCSPSEHLVDLVSGVYDTIGTKNLVGCTTGGEISDEGVTNGTAVLGGIVSDTIDFHVAYTEDLGKDSRLAGKRLAQDLPRNLGYLQLFSDGLTGNGCAILDGVLTELGERMPVVGGTAGDGGKFKQTWQIVGNKIFSNAVVALGFSGNFKVGTGVRSGWSPIGLAKRVTRASGNTLYELNGESALSVYERFLGKHAKKLPAIGVEYPLGIVEPWGDTGDDPHCLLRATMSVNRKEGSIRFAGEIPEGAMVHLTCGDKASILKAAEKSAHQARNNLGDIAPAVVFCYSCIARKIVLGRHVGEEVENVRRIIGGEVPILGFYTYGEFCRITENSPCYLHNETLTLSLIGD